MVIFYSSEGPWKERIGCTFQSSMQIEVSLSKKRNSGDRRACYNIPLDSTLSFSLVSWYTHFFIFFFYLSKLYLHVLINRNTKLILKRFFIRFWKLPASGLWRVFTFLPAYLSTFPKSLDHVCSYFFKPKYCSISMQFGIGIFWLFS